MGRAQTPQAGRVAAPPAFTNGDFSTHDGVRSGRRYARLTLLTLCLSLFLPERAVAHLIVAQHGTLTLTERGVYMVLSLPVSAFDGLDNNRDGRVTMAEFNRYRQAIVKAIESNVMLSEDQESVAIDGILLSPDQAHDAEPGILSHIVVMGHFGISAGARNVYFRVGLYGDQPSQQVLAITAASRLDGREAAFELTAENRASLIFPG